MTSVALVIGPSVTPALGLESTSGTVSEPSITLSRITTTLKVFVNTPAAKTTGPLVAT